MNTMSPESLGGLIVAYEHKTFFLSVLLGINCFDQWGVELGKAIASEMQALLRGDEATVASDPATLATVRAWQDANPTP